MSIVRSHQNHRKAWTGAVGTRAQVHARANVSVAELPESNMRGTVQWLNPKTAYAFVIAEDGQERFGQYVSPARDFFVVHEGDEIEFEIEEVSLVSSRMIITSVRRYRRAL
jgi:cold shock CspA family protein